MTLPETRRLAAQSVGYRYPGTERDTLGHEIDLIIRPVLGDLAAADSPTARL